MACRQVSGPYKRPSEVELLPGDIAKPSLIGIHHVLLLSVTFSKADHADASAREVVKGLIEENARGDISHWERVTHECDIGSFRESRIGLLPDEPKSLYDTYEDGDKRRSNRWDMAR